MKEFGQSKFESLFVVANCSWSSLMLLFASILGACPLEGLGFAVAFDEAKLASIDLIDCAIELKVLFVV